MEATSRTEARRGRGVILALLSATGFSTLGLFAKLIYAEGFSVPAALAWRFTIAALFLWAAVLVTKRELPKPLWPVIVLGFVGFAPQAGLYFATVRILDPGITGLLLYLYPSFVVIISLIVFRKKPGWLRFGALCLSLLGVLITFWKAGEYPALGIALGFAVAITYAAYLVASDKVLKRVDPVAATAIVMTAAALVYWTATFATGAARLPSTGPAIAGVLGVALFATVLPVTTLFASMRIIGASDASLVSTLEPVLTILWSTLLIGERFGPSQIFGGILIICAVLAIDLAPRLASFARAKS